MLRGTIRTINTYAYPFSHQHEITTHIEEFTERLASLLLGYGHAFSHSERPKDKLFLDTDYIIPFLFRYRHALLDVGKHKTPILGLEFEFFKSPLVQVVVKAVLPRGPVLQNNSAKEDVKVTPTKQGKVMHVPEQQQEDTVATITQLYTLWEESKVTSRAAYDLNTFIIKMVSPSRYDHKLHETMKVQLENADATVSFWNTCDRQLQAYTKFMNKFESIPIDTSHTLCPSVLQESNAVVDDSQLPNEILY